MDTPKQLLFDILKGEPTHNKGSLLKPKDKIIGVGQEDDGEIIDVVGWRLDDVVELIRGPKDSKVRLEIIPGTSLDDSNLSLIHI